MGYQWRNTIYELTPEIYNSQRARWQTLSPAPRNLCFSQLLVLLLVIVSVKVRNHGVEY